MKKELFNSLEASTRTNHPSPAFQAHKRTRSLAEIRGARQPAPSLPRRLPTKHARRPKGSTTPRKEARRRGKCEWHRHLQGETRARRRSTRGDGVGDRPPREACRKRDDRHTFVVASRFFGPRRAPRARVDVLCYGSGPSLRLLKAPARRAHGAVGVLHPPGCPMSQITATSHAQEGAKPWRGSTSVAKSSTTPLYIHRRRPPRRYQTETEISCHVVAQI